MDALRRPGRGRAACGAAARRRAGGGGGLREIRAAAGAGPAPTGLRRGGRRRGAGRYPRRRRPRLHSLDRGQLPERGAGGAGLWHALPRDPGGRPAGAGAGGHQRRARRRRDAPMRWPRRCCASSRAIMATRRCAHRPARRSRRRTPSPVIGARLAALYRDLAGEGGAPDAAAHGPRAARLRPGAGRGRRRARRGVPALPDEPDAARRSRAGGGGRDAARAGRGPARARCA